MLTLNINGKDQALDVPADMPLLWVLRDVAHLTGTKFGCGMAQCGACTVHVDGAPLRSCITPVTAVANGQKILTIEACPPTARTRCNKPGPNSMWCSAVTASRGRSCRPPRYWRRSPNPPTATLTRRCPAIFVAAAPTQGFGRQSNAPRDRLRPRRGKSVQ